MKGVWANFINEQIKFELRNINKKLNKLGLSWAKLSTKLAS